MAPKRKSLATKPRAKKAAPHRRHAKSRISLARLWCFSKGKGGYRQAFAGSDELGYPFNIKAPHIRDADRQRTVEGYASTLFPGAAGVLRAAGVKWVPSDANTITRSTLSEPTKDRVRRFIAIMYLFDLSYGVLKELKREATAAANNGILTVEVAQRVAGIVSNITGKGITPSENMATVSQAIRELVLPGQRGNARFADRSPYYPSYLYPISYGVHTTTKTVKDKAGGEWTVAGKSYLKTARDFDLGQGILPILNAGLLDTSEFSMVTRLNVFAPLGLEGEKGERVLTPFIPAAKEIEEIGATDSSRNVDIHTDAIIDRVQDGEGVDTVTGDVGRYVAVPSWDPNWTFNGSLVKLDVLNDDFGANIGRQERTRLWGAMSEVLNLCKRAAAKSGMTNPQIGGPDDPVPYIVPHGTCGPNEMPVGIGADGKVVQGYETPDGYHFIDPARIECVPLSAKPVWPRGRKAAGTALVAGQRPAVTLRQVEALPKAELARFVQRIVNI